MMRFMGFVGVVLALSSSCGGADWYSVTVKGCNGLSVNFKGIEKVYETEEGILFEGDWQKCKNSCINIGNVSFIFRKEGKKLEMAPSPGEEYELLTNFLDSYVLRVGSAVGSGQKGVSTYQIIQSSSSSSTQATSSSDPEQQDQ